MAKSILNSTSTRSHSCSLTTSHNWSANGQAQWQNLKKALVNYIPFTKWPYKNYGDPRCCLNSFKDESNSIGLDKT